MQRCGVSLFFGWEGGGGGECVLYGSFSTTAHVILEGEPTSFLRYVVLSADPRPDRGSLRTPMRIGIGNWHMSRISFGDTLLPTIE